ncbi:MAG: putative permease DMT superfamily [Bacteroidetes bacterium]|nr:MAG: putative permease DMT superfamily [Bacteroidota bacterium]
MTASGRAHLALIVSGLLYGANYWVAKGLMPGFMQPMQIIFTRGLVSLVLMWVVAYFFKDRSVEKSDHRTLAACGLTGIAINQAFFFIGLNLTSPVDTALIHSGSPVIVLLFSALLAGEKTGRLKIAGIALGASGALLLVLQGNFNGGGSNHLVGNTLIFLNIVSYSLYLVMVKPLMAKYSAFTIMKWVFLYGFVFALPFCVTGLREMSFTSFTPYAWFAISYVVIGTTFISYLLTTWSLKIVSVGIAGYYIYMQPVIAATIGIILFNESLTLPKILSAILVFTGVFLVNRNPAIRKGAGKG